MRVISGYLKGKNINFIKNSKTRPLKDIVKENIFNILRHSNLIKVKLENSKVLDLYSGIGSFGIECLSRGSDEVTFVENNSQASKILNENLIKLSVKKKTALYNGKVENFFKQELKKKFDIFFFDPPFNDKNFLNLFELIKLNKLFKKNNIVIIHRDKLSHDFLENKIDIIDIKTYGRSKIFFGVFT